MKAAQDFSIIVDSKGDRYTHPVMSGEEPKGTKRLNFKKGDKVGAKYLADLLLHNPDYLEHELKNGCIVLPKGVDVQLLSLSEDIKKVEKAHIATGGEYTMENLTEKLNKMGFKKFKVWAKRKFGATDRSGKQLIVEILDKQDEALDRGEVL